MTLINGESHTSNYKQKYSWNGQQKVFLGLRFNRSTDFTHIYPYNGQIQCAFREIKIIKLNDGVFILFQNYQHAPSIN